MRAEVTMKDGSKDALEQIEKLRDLALVEGAIIIEGECIVRCPVDTGRLRGSITRRVRLGDGSVLAAAGKDGLGKDPDRRGEAHIGTNVEYAAHVEYGTRFQKAQPYMRPGAVAALPKVERRFSERLGERIRITRLEEQRHDV